MDRLLFCRGHDRDRLPDDTPRFSFGCRRRTILLTARYYILRIRRYSGNLPVQYAGGHHPCARRLQNAGLFPDFIQPFKHCAGSAFHRTDRNRHRRSCLLTVISQAVSGILCLIYMKKNLKSCICTMRKRASAADTFTFSAKWVFRWDSILDHRDRLGCHPDCHQLLGSIAVASVTAGQKIGMFFCCPFDALGGTMATYAGQNAGAGKVDRIRASGPRLSSAASTPLRRVSC